MNSTSATALIWWVIPIAAVLCAIGYAVWVTKYKNKFDNKTDRSISEFVKFQNSFNNKK